MDDWDEVTLLFLLSLHYYCPRDNQIDSIDRVLSSKYQRSHRFLAIGIGTRLVGPARASD